MKTAKTQDEFVDLFGLVLTPTWYTFNSQFYQHTDAAAVGGQASSTTAEIYMQAYEETTIYTSLHPPKVLERFVDDSYSISKCKHFFHHSNNKTIKTLSLQWMKGVTEN